MRSQGSKTINDPNRLRAGVHLASEYVVGAPSSLLGTAFEGRGVALMGVLNVTPDSFFDGGRYTTEGAAESRIDELIREGAQIIDIGGESSRPGSEPVAALEQIARIEGAVRHAVASRKAVVSVDTTSPEVADRMLALGAEMLNDVSCLHDPDLARVAARREATLVLMHARQPMSEMAGFSRYPDDAYRDVVSDVLGEWRAARDRALSAGMPRDRVWLDPGLGFSKNARQSLALLARLDELCGEGVPVVVGPSRKSFIASVDDAPPEQRLGGTIAACLSAAAKGAKVLRVHDIRAVRQALGVAGAIERARAPGVAHA
jgi:dihydropteroate synthase